MKADVRERIRQSLIDIPGQMTVQVAREFGVSEAEVLRLLPGDQAVELDLGKWKELLESFADLGKVHVILSNGAATLESVGEFGNFSVWGEFFNVQTKSLDMHIRHAQLGAVFAVDRPTPREGVNTLAFLFFDKQGQSAFKVYLSFGGKAPAAKVQKKFEELREAFRISA